MDATQLDDENNHVQFSPDDSSQDDSMKVLKEPDV